MGPTASGKSEVALRIAEDTGAEIISADSMQVYREMDIGTAKPTPQERALVTHRLIDVADPETAFTVAEYQALGREVLDRLERADAPAIIVGGSGLHFRALVDPLVFRPTDPELRTALEYLEAADAVRMLLSADPDAGEHVDLANPRRVIRALEIHRLTGETPSGRSTSHEAAAIRDYRPARAFAAVGFDPAERLEHRVELRMRRMMEAGLLEEVRRLAPRLGPTASRAVGYRQLLSAVSGRCALDEGERWAVDATRALARRQRTFFRRDPRLRWLEWDDDASRRTVGARSALEEAGWIS